MVRWQAVGPVAVRLETPTFSCDGITICRYERYQLHELLKDDEDYWSRVFLSLFKGGYWLKMDFEVEKDEKAWNKAFDQISVFLQTLGLFKSVLSLLAVGGLLVKRMEEGPGPSAHFGAEITMIGGPHYFLRKHEYDSFVDLLTKYRKFWRDNKFTGQSTVQLKRINLARRFFAGSSQTKNLVERCIWLSVALEALYGEGQQELKYRYSNRSALLLGDNTDRRRKVHDYVKRLYQKRSDILHGRVSWRIEPQEILIYNEIIRLSLLRSISLYAQGCRNISKTLDDCMHDPTKHAKLLADAKAFFGTNSEYKELEELARSHRWAVR